MSLYNHLFGVNPLAGLLMEMLKIDHDEVPRFRDCFLSKDGTEIIIHTRTGGGNREDYAEGNARLTKVIGYKRDEDDDFDCTYANFYFEVPKKYRFMIPVLMATIGETSIPRERWEDLFKKLRGRK